MPFNRLALYQKTSVLWLFVKKTTKRKYWLISFLCFFNRIIVHTEMSGCFEYVRLPNIEWLEVGDRRNVVASIIAGLLVSKLLFLRDYICNHWARICYRDEVHLDTIPYIIEGGVEYVFYPPSFVRPNL